MHKINYFIQFLSIIFLKAIFDYLYFVYVSKYFMGDLFYLNYSSEKHLYSYILLVIVSIFVIPLINQPNKPSRVVILILFLSIIVPILTLYAYQDADNYYVAAIVISFILIILQIMYFPILKFRILHASLMNTLLLGIILIYIYVYSYLIFTGGLTRFNFNLKEVYDVRAEYVTMAAKGPLLGYFITWVGNSFNMGALVWGLFKKNRNIIILAIVLQLLLFGMTNFKSFLFAPVLVMSLYFLAKRKSLLLYSTISITMILMFSYLFFIFYNDHQWSSMFIRRQFFVPSNLHLIYYDFFKEDYNPYINLSNSIFSSFLEYPYQASVTRIISWEYWNRDFGPNVGFLGDAYSHFGFLGMFLFAFILGLILRILDSFVTMLPS
ncbi:hypothetical protein D2910_15665 [Planomicrobium okeanokoites]|uniref:hypothetical protein n=1 Tax=Planomicrobium okeanokoites TaxID=244 RepID=UPI000E3BE56D|nr:hypothetical protein [Planomicrobium okeanokoites]TAA66084.1 hypothetical protein D2910_15665 [Planomicrobium okeanokoites]